jgi:hypothetical protein
MMLSRVTLLLSLLSSATAFGVVNRRQALIDSAVGTAAAAATTIAVVATTATATPAFAEPTDETPRTTTRMGGLLEKYQDSNRGWVILAPSGWNKFDGEVGAYDVKWQDLVDPRDNIKVSSTPVKSTTTSMYVTTCILMNNVVVVVEGIYYACFVSVYNSN